MAGLAPVEDLFVGPVGGSWRMDETYVKLAHALAGRYRYSPVQVRPRSDEIAGRVC